MCDIMRNPPVTKLSGSILQVREIYAYAQTNMEKAGYNFPSQLAEKNHFFSTAAECSKTAIPISWANEAHDMGKAVLLLIVDIVSKEKDGGGGPRV